MIWNNREIFLKHYLTLPAQEVISIFNTVPAGQLPFSQRQRQLWRQKCHLKIDHCTKPRIVH